MEQKKCTECGQILPEGVMYCPNCGCPVEASSEYVNVEQQQTVVSTPLENKSFPTTDTGDKYENAVKTCADVIWYLGIAAAIIYCIVTTFMLSAGSTYTGAVALLGFFGSLIGSAIILGSAYVARAFIMVIHNISINVHEINMKTKPQE